MLSLIRKNLTALTLGLLASALLACGDPNDLSFNETERPVDDADRVDLSVGKSDAKGLFIIDAAAFTISVTGCSSGYTTTLTAAKTKFNIYKNDRNCLARLLDFTRNGKKYTPVPGSDFVTLAQGERAIFSSVDGTDTVTVKIVNQLSNPIQAGDSIDFIFVETKAATQNVSILKTVFGDMGRATRSGSPAINFKVKSAQLSTIDSATGRGRMIFKVECLARLVRVDNNNTSCSNVRLRNLSYVLINDTFGGSPCASNPRNCDQFFTSATESRVRITDFLDPGQDGVVNGGFTTFMEPTLALLTPGKLNITPNMLLIVTDGSSYQWFNLDLQVNSSAYLALINPSLNEEEE